MKGDFYLLYLAILSVFAGVYTLVNHKSTEDPMLNLQIGIVFSVVGAILALLFIRQTKRSDKK
jgi:glucose uptake protein GlcU